MLRRPTINANVVDMLPASGRRGFLAQFVALVTGAKVAQAVAAPRVVAYDHVASPLTAEQREQIRQQLAHQTARRVEALLQRRHVMLYGR